MKLGIVGLPNVGKSTAAAIAATAVVAAAPTAAAAAAPDDDQQNDGVKENFYRRLPFLRSRFYRFVSEGISRFDKISVKD